CDQYKCNANLECSVEPKECVKTMPYIEMDCYIAKCNEKTGQCENRLSCDTFSSCGGGASGESICYCNATTNNKCFCEKKEGDNNCDSNKNEICDYTQDPPKCVVSRCKEDLTISGCQYQKCNETTGNAYYVDIECTETIKEVDSRCKDMFTYICMDGKCVVKAVVSEDELKVECGYCEYNSVSNSVVYISNCEKTQSRCGSFEGKCIEGKCVYPQSVSADPNVFCLNCTSLLCGGDLDVYKYSYNEVTGLCSYSLISQVPQCSVCSEQKYTSTCKGKELEKTWTSEEGVSMKYKIPKDCKNDQCIPRYPLTCQEYDLFGEILDTFGNCRDYMRASYHYSSKFDTYNFAYGYKQSEIFMDEADEEAYCEWTFEKINCKKCVSHPSNGSFEDIDECPKRENGVDYICLNNECIVDPDFSCPVEHCVVKKMNEDNSCEFLYDMCEANELKVEDARKVQSEKYDKIGKTMSCANIECLGTRCPVFANDQMCQINEGEHPDYGCRVSLERCDTANEVYWCKFKSIVKPEEDNKYFLERDNVKLNNKCFNYYCEENCTGEGKNLTCEHHWKIDESISNANPQPRNPCEDATCNALTGETEYAEKPCFVSEEFPTLTANQARCFYCKCSYIDGSPSLIMYAETEDEHYELDQCGNCKVMNQSDRTQQLNQKVECVLSAEMNSSGAIAAATTVAAVVAALVIGMVAVSIGIFNTYQLITSAMKNVVSVAAENPQFQAAENVADNTNFNE
ncbi:galactose-specific adhesin 170kD subunit, partial [Entamoeba invadens IP1]